MSFRALREQKHLSQEALAELCGLSLRTIQRAEAGHRVSYASLRALAAAFETATEISAWHWRPVRTLRGTLFDYGFVLAVLVVFWLAR